MTFLRSLTLKNYKYLKTTFVRDPILRHVIYLCDIYNVYINTIYIVMRYSNVNNEISGVNNNISEIFSEKTKS